MSLIFDERKKLAGQAGLHALISGVSFYKHLPGGDGQLATSTYGMEQLQSPAISAYQLCAWLLKVNSTGLLPAPLATVRLLLSPSSTEINLEPALNGLTNRCLRDNFARDIHEWRDDASKNSSDTTFFYFCGHGVQRKKDDAILLFEDFGSPFSGPLNFAATMDNIFYGMAPPADPTKTIARNQLYLVDACRIQPTKFAASDWLNVPDLWAVDRGGVDNRTAPIFYAAVPGTEANGRAGQISVFCEALVNCLNRTAAEYKQDSNGIPRWQVNSILLVRALKFELENLNRQYQTNQEFATSGYFQEMVISYLQSAPTVDLDIEIDPTGAPYFNLTITDINTNSAVCQFAAPFLSPQRTSVTAGLYKFAAQIASPPQPPFRDCLEYWPIMPPARTMEGASKMTAGDANLKFDLDFKSTEFSQLELPIEVRKTDLELVGRPLSSETISVDPGTYFISAELPSGQKITRLEEVSSGDNSIKLTPDSVDSSPHESHERTHFLRTDFNELQKVDRDLVDPTRKGRSRILRGNPLLGHTEKLSSPATGFQQPLDSLNKLWKISIPSVDEMPNWTENEFFIAQFIQPGRPVLNFALPRSRRHGCELVVTPSTDGNYRVSVQLENVEADLMLRYREENLFDQLDVLSRSGKVDPEGLLAGKMEDPIAAAMGAYTILRFGQMERLHDWTENLKNWVQWLPDGAAIRGEHLARSGNVEGALNAFLLLRSRGLPFFSDGLNYAIDRLRLYKEAAAKYLDSNGRNLSSQAEELLRDLEKFEPYADFSRAALTFTGLTPEEPDDLVMNDIPSDVECDFLF